MADAVLNGLTGGRHSNFMEKFRVFEEKERKVKESLRMEVQTPPGNKDSPETRNGSAAPSEGDRASSVVSSEDSREQTPLGVERCVKSEEGGSQEGGSEVQNTPADESEGSGDIELLEVSCYCSLIPRPSARPVPRVWE